MPSGRDGVTLVELLISISILGFLVIAGLAAFSLTSNLFQESLVRQSAENQARAFEALMGRDFALADSWLATVTKRGSANSRDALSLPALDDWRKSTNFRPTKRPAWNRYVVWYANNAESGLLVRQVVAPDLPKEGYFTEPYAALSANLSETDPLSNSDLVYSQAISKDVVDFEVNLFPGAPEANVRLSLLSSGAHRAGGKERVREHVDLNFKFPLKNTWPKI